MDDRRLEDKLDKITEKIANIDVTLAKQELSLADHIRRTALLEESVKPIEKHVAMMHGVVKFFGFLALATGLISGLLKIMGKL